MVGCPRDRAGSAELRPRRAGVHPVRRYNAVVTKSKSVIASALQLPREERARVAREIIASLDDPADQDVEAAWLAEVERRLDEVERGTAKLVPWEAVRQRVTDRLRATRR